MKSLRIFLVAVTAAIITLSLFSATGVSAQTPTPTLTQKEIFDAKLARLKANAASMPIKVDEVIQSLTGPWGFSFICPEESLVFACTLSITTTVKDWDSKEAEEIEKKTGNTPVGIYMWDVSWQTVGDIKTIIADNWVMLDLAVTTADEADPPIGPIVDEGLLYHELLHGQLLINDMRDPSWQAKACHCDVDLDPTGDNYHSEIYLAQAKYLTNRAGKEIRVVEVDRPKKAEVDGTFTDIDLGPTDKKVTTPYPQIIEPSGGGNVEGIVVRVENGRVYVSGKLKNINEKGRFLVRIDPEDEWIIGGLENALMVLPPEVPVGGIAVPVDKLGLLAPYFGLASTILVATAAIAIYVKHVKRRKKKQ